MLDPRVPRGRCRTPLRRKAHRLARPPGFMLRYRCEIQTRAMCRFCITAPGRDSLEAARFVSRVECHETLPRIRDDAAVENAISRGRCKSHPG